MSLIEDMTELARRARLASRRLASVSADDKNNCLLAMADSIEANAQFIRDENKKDMDVGAEMGLAKPILDRLLLDEARIGGMATGFVANARNASSTASTASRSRGTRSRRSFRTL